MKVWAATSDKCAGGGLSGLTEPFPAGVIEKLYPDRSAYTAQIKAAARAAEAAGVILPDQTLAYIREAELADLGR